MENFKKYLLEQKEYHIKSLEESEFECTFNSIKGSIQAYRLALDYLTVSEDLESFKQIMLGLQETQIKLLSKAWESNNGEFIKYATSECIAYTRILDELNNL